MGGGRGKVGVGVRPSYVSKSINKLMFFGSKLCT